MSIIIFIIAINLTIAFKLWWDWTAKNKEGRIIKHGLSSVIDGSLYVISSLVILGLFGKFNLIVQIGSVVLAVSWRWIIFDILFGDIYWNGIDWHGKSSKLDVWLVKLGRFHFLIKLVPVAIGLALIIFNVWIWELLS